MLRFRIAATKCRLPHFSLRFSHTRSLHFLSPFFAPNLGHSSLYHHEEHHLNEPEKAVNDYIRSQAPFLDPNLHYPAVEITDKTVMETVLEHTFVPFKTWKDISENQDLSPIAGSFIEFEKDSKLVLGAVVSECQSKFNEFHNKLIVLTMDNELVRVYPQDIHFTAYQVLEKDWIDNLEILPNRFDEEYPARTRLVTILHQFVATANSMRKDSQEYLRIAYSRMVHDSQMRPTSLPSLMEIHQAESLESYFHQAAKLISIHWEMCKDPSRWLVASCIPTSRSTNIVAHRCSNELPPLPLYMATSLDIFSNVDQFLQYDELKLLNLNLYIEELAQSQKSFDSLSDDINIWSGKQYGPAFRAMAYATFYPHNRITNMLLKINIFGNRVSHSTIHEVLRKIGLYDNPENPLTDILLSTGLLGKPARAALSVTSKSAIEPSSSISSSLVDAQVGNLKDYYPHLRHKREHYRNMAVYALPGQNGHSKFAFSLDKINERKYFINIHVPDVAAQLSPSSRTFETWSQNSGLLNTIKELLDGDQIEILHEKAIDALLFSKFARNSLSSFFSVGDLSNLEDDITSPCMTLTFEYNVYKSNPLQKIGDLVFISFDELHRNQIKFLDEETLDKTLTGRLHPRIMDSFRLFTRTSEPDNSIVLDESDHFNINFIYNTMTRHFLQRNRKCASTLEPKKLRKKILKSTIFDKETCSVVSKILLQSKEDVFKTQKRNFFIDELRIFAGAMAAEYCQLRDIPVYRTKHSLLDTTVPQNIEEDEVLITHENMFLPNFHGNSYFQTILGRDSLGYVSTSAYFIGNNYLARSRLHVGKDSHNLPLGLSSGHVDVNALESVAGYINQLQILAYHQASELKRGFREYSKQYGGLKKYGYPLHGPLSSEVLKRYRQRLEDSDLAAKYVAARQRAFWTLVHVKQQEELNVKLEYNCIVTRMGPSISTQATLAWAFCEELTMEIRLYVRTDVDISIGSRVMADNILHVDPDSGMCVMEHREPF